eukprot:5212245-Lingulodinium_polyedra.AAC.1
MPRSRRTWAQWQTQTATHPRQPRSACWQLHEPLGENNSGTRCPDLFNGLGNFALPLRRTAAG